jgi:hypothetical protein
MIKEIADGLLAHSKNGKLSTEIDFMTDSAFADNGLGGGNMPWPLFTAASKLTGDNKYLEPLSGRNTYKREFDREALVKRYTEDITNLGVREYINTEGSTWIDRVSPFSTSIQEDRLGGIALARINSLYPCHYVSWKLIPPSTFESTAIYLPKAGPESLEIIAYNLDLTPVNTQMTLWNITPGRWRIRQGTDINDDQVIDGIAREIEVDLKRGKAVDFVFEPRKYNIVSMELIEPSKENNRYLPDLGIGNGDIRINGDSVIVRVHSLGGAGTPAATLELRDATGKVAAVAKVPPMEAPSDLVPRRTKISVTVPEGTDLTAGSVQIDPGYKIIQITVMNDLVRW